MSRDLDRFKNIEVDWNEVLTDDPDMLGGILRDVVRKGRKSSVLERNEKAARFRQINGVSHLAEEKFHVALNALREGNSVEVFARRVDIPVFVLEPLLGGDVVPDNALMMEIAESLDKPYNFFLEVRIHAILGSIESFLMNHPETVDAWVRRVE